MNREGIYGDSLKQALAKVDRIEAVRAKVRDAHAAVVSLESTVSDDLQDELNCLHDAIAGLSDCLTRAREDVDRLAPHFPNAAE